MVVPPGPIPLAEVPSSRKVSVQEIRGGFGQVRRLAALGIVPGTVVTVIRNAMAGPMIVEARQSRLALGRGVAMKILVRLEEER